MTKTSLVPNAQDARLSDRCLSAVIDSESGRQITNLCADLISLPLIEIRCAGLGFGWHDAKANEWQQMENGRWKKLGIRA